MWFTGSMGRKVLFSVCAVVVAGSNLQVLAQQRASDREKALEQRVQELEQRLRELERIVAAQGVKEATPQEDLAKRVAELEASENKRKETKGLLSPRWKDGLVISSEDKAFELKIGGRLHLDWVFADEDSELEKGIGELDEGVEFRRARLGVAGLIYDRVEYKAEYDFAGDGTADWQDVYLGLRKIPVLGNARLGHFKEPFSLDQLIGSNYTMFMERSLANALVPARNTGLMVQNHVLEERATWAVGVFRDSDAFGNRTGNDLGNEWNFTGRVTALPWYDNEGRQLLHLGLAASNRHPNKEDHDSNKDTETIHAVRYRSRPEVHIGPYLADTRYIPAEEVNLLGAEAALVLGPASLQSEYLYADVDATMGADDPAFSAWYVQGSFFLTGEHRPYKTTDGAFSRVKPKRNAFDGEGGSGAWELALRYSALDLEDEKIDGGNLDDVTLGLNWYLNPNARVMWNYVHAMSDWGAKSVDAGADVFQMRFQVDF